MTSTRDIIGHFDALDAGDVGLFLCSDGTIGAHMTSVDIRSEHVCKSLVGYGATVEAALLELWERATNLEDSDVLRVQCRPDRRYVQWNGFNWKPAQIAEVFGQ